MKDLVLINNLNRDKKLGDPVQYQYVYEVNAKEGLVLMLENQKPVLTIAINNGGKDFYVDDSMIRNIVHTSDIRILHTGSIEISESLLSAASLSPLTFNPYVVTERRCYHENS